MNLSIRCVVFLTVFVSVAADTQAGENATLHTTVESVPEAKLSWASDSGELAFEAAGKDELIRVSCDQVVSWGAWQPAFSQPTVWTADGSWIVGEVSFSETRLSIKPWWAADVEIPLSQVGGLLLHAPANPNQRRELIGEMLESEGARDLVWLTSGQKVSGLLQIKQDAERTQFLLSNGGQSVTLAADEIRAIVFSPELVAPPRLSNLQQAVGLTDGTLVCVSDLGRTLAALTSKRGASLETAGGVKFDIHAQAESEATQSSERRPRTLIDHVIFLASSPARCMRLSREEPVSYKYSSESLLDWPLGKNRDVRQSMMTAGRGIQPCGIAMHATSQVAFRIGEDCKQFIAEVTLSGVPAAESSSRTPSPVQRELGSVTCEVLVARGGKLQQLAEVELSSVYQRRAQINVDCQGSQLVVLVVREADKGNYGDEVYWNEARLIR